MKWIGTKNIGMLLLAIWLIASGVLALVHVSSVQTGGLSWPRSPSRLACCSCWAAKCRRSLRVCELFDAASFIFERRGASRRFFED
jgi:hypothetical protein